MAILENKNRFVTVIILIAVFVLLVRLLIFFDSFHSALMYIGIPFLVAIALLYFTDHSQQDRWYRPIWNSLRDALIIFLSSSIFLHEGFLCVLMFLPIYFLVFLLTTLIYLFTRSMKNRKNRNRLHWVSVFVVIILSFEGVHPLTSFDRNDSAYSSRVVNLNIEQLKRNLRKPIFLNGNRPWFLQVFPMPVKIQAGTLHPGAIHKIDYVYKRWFFTNTHKGQMILKIKNVGENFVITEILKDTSYISNYLELKGTHIKFDKLDNNRTKVTLRIFYKRHLDPSWYFGPMERYAISQMSRYMIRKIIVRD